MRRTRIPGPALCCIGLLLWACLAPAAALAEDKPWTEVQPGRGPAAPWTEVQPGRGVDASQWTERTPGGAPRRPQQGGTDAAGQPLPTPEQAAKAAEQGDDASQSAANGGVSLVPTPQEGQPIPVRRRATISRSGGGSTKGKKLALIIGLTVGGVLLLGGGGAAAAILLTRHTQPALPVVTLP